MELIDYVKPGDILTLERGGYAPAKRRHRVTRKTKASIFVWYNESAEGKLNRYGTLMPRDKYVNTYVTHVNGIPLADILKLTERPEEGVK